MKEDAPRIPVTALFAREFRWLTLATCLLWLLTSLVAYSFSTWVPTLYVDVFHLPLALSLKYSAVTGVGYMLTPLFFALILDSVGRRTTGIVAAMLTLLTLITLWALGGTHAGWSVLLMAVGWITAGSSFMLLWPYTAEIFPTKMRSSALGLCSALARAGSTLTPIFVAGVLSATGQIGMVFAVLAIPTAIVLALWLFNAREMARQPLDEAGAAAS